MCSNAWGVEITASTNSIVHEFALLFYVFGFVWCRVSLLLMFVCGLGFVCGGSSHFLIWRFWLWFGVTYFWGRLYGAFFFFDSRCLRYPLWFKNYICCSVNIHIGSRLLQRKFSFLASSWAARSFNVTLRRRRRCYGRVRLGPIVNYDMGYVLQLHHARSNWIKANEINFVTHVLLNIFIRHFFLRIFLSGMF